MAGETVPVDDLPSAGAVPVSDLPESYRPVSAETVKRSAGAMGRKVSSAVQKVLGTRDSDVDYSGVDAPGTQAQYSLIKKPEDRKTYLESEFGKENVTKDSFGRDVVIQDGKKVSFEPISAGEEGKNLASQWTSKAGQVLPAVGMVAGDIAGGGSTPT